MRTCAGLGGALSLFAVLAVQTTTAQDWIATALSRIHRQYTATTLDVAQLVLLDRELRNMIAHDQWQERPFLPATYLKPEYDDIGITLAAFDRDFLGYSGKLLGEAHARDPDSPFRSYTLYSTVFGGAGQNPTDVPSPDAAQRYLREFPDGPFSVDAHLALAHFYDDLHKVIGLEEAGRRVDYKYDCYARFITSVPLSEQRRTARESAIQHYERVVELLPRNLAEAKYFAEIRQEKNEAWFFCAD